MHLPDIFMVLYQRRLMLIKRGLVPRRPMIAGRNLVVSFPHASAGNWEQQKE